jgi:hypothetical protein
VGGWGRHGKPEDSIGHIPGVGEAGYEPFREGLLSPSRPGQNVLRTSCQHAFLNKWLIMEQTVNPGPRSAARCSPT